MVTVHDLVKETGTSKVLWTERETNFNSCEELSLVENPLESLYFSKKYVALIGDVISDTLL